MSEDPLTQAAPAASADKPGGIRGFFATTIGKIVIIGGAVGALAAILGVVAFLLLSAFVTTPTGEQTQIVGTPGAPTTSTVAAVAATAPPVANITNRDVFTPRNPFEPVLAPLSAFKNPNASRSSGASRGSIFLERIIAATSTSPAKADLFLGSTEYVLAEGESIPGTPWRVDRIRSASVTMQYGDDYIVLYPGSGVTK